ncbi:MAG: hypothetical protein WCQ26_10420, partial [Pseudanabaena sp. ELA748]
MLWPIKTNAFIANQLFDIMPKCAKRKYIISGFPEYEVTPDKLDHEQRDVLIKIAKDIVISSKTNSPIVAVLVVGHADVAMRKQPSERAVFEQDKSLQRANEALKLVLEEVRRQFRDALEITQTRAIGVGSTQRLVTNPVSESQRRINRRVEVFLAQCLLPPEPPANDTLEKRVERLLKLLETRRVDPDSTGTRTNRAKCLLPKLLKPGVIEVFVDGGVANQTINGMTPKFHECLIPGRNVGWLGNYDGTKKPMPNSEFIKFLGTLSPILKGPGFAPNQSDDHVLQVLGQVILNIDDGINMVDNYINRMGMMSDPIVKKLLDIDGFAGDVARKKLQKLYRDHLNDENNIYS